MALTTQIAEPPPLGALAQDGSIALFLDFDGTLVPIADTPDGIAVPQGLGAMLERLAARHGDRLAVISGRSISDIRSHVGTPSIAMAGSHGAERCDRDGSPIGAAPAALSDVVIQALTTFAHGHPGVEQERKDHGGALHYRAAPEMEDEVHTFLSALADTHGLSIKRGKCVVEITGQGASKADAVDIFMAEERFANAMPVFLGDDVTDEDGFAACERHGGYGIQIGVRDPTRARYRLADPQAVHAWLGLDL
jgi:trehalose 6-phosphate phosphatase